jgi:hypothetical protein
MVRRIMVTGRVRDALVGWFVLTTIFGCNRAPVSLTPVRGTVKFTDGAVPTGEVAQIRFEPIAPPEQKIVKSATGDIQSDGTYELMTVKPGDGAIPGKYKVCFTIHKTYLGQESLVPAKYTEPDTTPLEVTVEPKNNTPFEFQLDRE